MYRNTVTGEFILIQGEAAKVSYVPKKGGIEQRWKEILEAHSEVGSWELVTHTHPKGTPFASGARGDFGAIVREGLNSRTARTSEILFPRNDGTGLGKTEFGFDPDSAQPYWIKPDGSDQTYTFGTLSEYLAFVGVHESVPPWVPRGRVDWSKRGELLEAYEQWSAERRARERQSQEGPSEPEQGVTTAAEGVSSRDEGAPRSSDAAVAGVETADVGAKSREPLAAGAGRSRSQDPNFDIPGGPAAPSSPRGVSYVNHGWADYDVLERPAEGLSDSYRLRDKATGDIYLFKPAKGEQDVPRAVERGIRKGEQAPRTKATELTASRLGIETPEVELVRIGTRPGSLTKWVGLDSLGRLEKSNNDLFQEIVRSDEYLALRARIDALDYLTNNLDRNKNFGNYLYELGPDGRTVVRLVPIDHDLTFTTTVPRANLEKYTRDLPTQMTREMAENLVALSRDRAGFQEEIRGLVGDEALPGVIHRLDELLNRAQRLHPDVFQTVGAHS
jgi:hypothetical protein